jgi:hypothetical protein
MTPSASKDLPLPSGGGFLAFDQHNDQSTTL